MTQYQRNPAQDIQIYPTATIAEMLRNGQQEYVMYIIELLGKGNTNNEYYVARLRPGKIVKVPDEDERCVYIDAYYTVFQKKPIPTPLDIPWHVVAPQWTYAAMAKCGRVWFYTDRPFKDALGWERVSGNMVSGATLNICTEGIDWENSLTFRPEGQ